mgnify:CR=1 FL=1|jgi:hypothetical protein
MATHKQLMVNVPVTEKGMGSSNTASLVSAYGASPIHAGEINDDSIKQLAQQLLLDGVVNDGGHTFGEFNRDYIDAPTITDVETGAGGLPASPYVPNPSSPGPGSFNATDIPAPPEGFGSEPGNQWGSGVGSQLEPSQASAAQSTGQLNDYPLGKAPGSV